MMIDDNVRCFKPNPTVNLTLTPISTPNLNNDSQAASHCEAVTAAEKAEKLAVSLESLKAKLYNMEVGTSLHHLFYF